MEGPRRRAFIDAYDRVREDEEWGGDDLDLPFHPRRHRDVWVVRQRTFRVFHKLITRGARGVAVDVGAGNCWLTRYLAAWGFDAIAVDINRGAIDGLEAAAKRSEPVAFARVSADMDSLPLTAGRVTLVVANASFHYAADFTVTLAEFRRVLADGGRIAILDSPFYRREADGERMVAERVERLRSKYGIATDVAAASRYLTFSQMRALATAARFGCSIHHVWPGAGRTWARIRSRARGHRIAEFPVVILEKASNGGTLDLRAGLVK